MNVGRCVCELSIFVIELSTRHAHLSPLRQKINKENVGATIQLDDALSSIPLPLSKHKCTQLEKDEGLPEKMTVKMAETRDCFWRSVR